MRSYKVNVTDTAAVLVEADDTTRTVYIHHDKDNTIVYVGGDNVTSTNGFHIHKLETLAFAVPQKETIWAICAESEDCDVWVLTPDPDDDTAGLYADPEPEEEPTE